MTPPGHVRAREIADLDEGRGLLNFVQRSASTPRSCGPNDFLQIRGGTFDKHHSETPRADVETALDDADADVHRLAIWQAAADTDAVARIVRVGHDGTRIDCQPGGSGLNRPGLLPVRTNLRIQGIPSRQPFRAGSSPPGGNRPHLGSARTHAPNPSPGQSHRTAQPRSTTPVRCALV
jgi:hypothetical protein